jgi:predicted small secreted protein
MKFSSLSLISRLVIVGLAGIIISACSSTMEGIGKDLQNMGTSMGGSSNSTQTTQQNNQSQTKGKDVIVTPVK